jgi:hypothetical protein
MPRAGFRVVALAALGLICPGLGGLAHAEEADNFTCRSRLSKDAVSIMNTWVKRQDPGCDRGCQPARRNVRMPRACSRSCEAGGRQRSPSGDADSTFTLQRWVDDQPGIERCHLKFSETIYGARSYNRPWIYPFNGKIIFVADSIRLAGRTVGVDKIDHFIREGLDHWKTIDQNGGDIAASIAREMGPAKRQFTWTEYGLKGMSLTGVLAYADIAAGYSGYRFWDDLLSLDRPGSFVALDPATRRYRPRRPFTFADYVNDAWDESLNPSTYDPKLAKEVEAALTKRSMANPLTTCHALAQLPHANLYVNPACLIPSPPKVSGAGVHSTTACPIASNSASIPSATSPSTAPAGRNRRLRPCETSWPRPSWPTGWASMPSASANITAPTSRSPRPRSFWAPSPAAPNG